MKTAKELVAALKNIMSTGDNCFPAVVVSVDKVKNSCDVDFSDMEIGEVRLQATIVDNQKGVKIYPAVGSVVIIEKMGDKGEYLLKMFSEVEQVVVEIDNTHFEIKEGFLVKRDDDTLKQVLTLLIEAVQTIIVIEGTNPDRLKLSQALTKVNNILK